MQINIRTIAAVVTAALAIAGAMPAAAAVEDDVMALTQAACDAFRLRDVGALERLLAPEFTLVGPSADVQTREQALAEVRAGEPRYAVFRNHSMSARVWGDAAVVVGITSLEGTAGGKPFKADVRFTDTLIRRDGRWQMVASQATRIP